MSDVALKYVIPIAGVLIGNAMFASPLSAVMKVRREKALGVRWDEGCWLK
jgi:ABC-type iron transport system FetAB permease component